MPSTGSLFSLLIMALLYYQLGSALERTWGTFRFNVYIFSGMIFTVIGAFILYGITCLLGGGVHECQRCFSAVWIQHKLYQSVHFSCICRHLSGDADPADVYHSGQDEVDGGYLRDSTAAQLIEGNWASRIAIVMSLLNFIIFFLSTRDVKRYSPHEVKRRQQFKSQMSRPQNLYAGGAHHKCTVCGRTELDDPTLEFRFCSKCEGNYEYCQDHLFTHQHMRRS